MLHANKSLGSLSALTGAAGTLLLPDWSSDPSHGSVRFGVLESPSFLGATPPVFLPWVHQKTSWATQPRRTFAIQHARVSDCSLHSKMTQTEPL